MTTLPNLSEERLAQALRELESPRASCCKALNAKDWVAESAPLYQGRSSSEVERLRGFVMMRLAQHGMAGDLYQRAVEDLSTATEPYLLAAAARIVQAALRPSASLPALLLSAIERIRHVDQFVNFENYPPQPGTSEVTAMDVLIETLVGLEAIGSQAVKLLADEAERGGHVSQRSRALLQEARMAVHASPAPSGRSCCGGQDSRMPAAAPHTASSPSSNRYQSAHRNMAVSALANVALENQDGLELTFGQLFGGRVSVIAFFYTRCMNPEKCSRTIGQLALLRALLDGDRQGKEAVVAAITYDPAFDSAARLRRFGVDRNMAFGDRCHFLRTNSPFETVSSELDLDVGFGPATVNRHRVEVFLVQAHGSIERCLLNGFWTAEDVYHQVRPLLALSATGG